MTYVSVTRKNHVLSIVSYEKTAIKQIRYMKIRLYVYARMEQLFGLVFFFFFIVFNSPKGKKYFNFIN